MMLAPYRWICDYAKVTSAPAELAEKMIMTGNGVEGIEYLGEDIVNVIVGRIEKLEKHPDADKLQICMIDVGEEALLQIVTGADNVFEGAYIPVARAVATLPGGVIKKGKLRGVESFGMLCSGEELNLKEEDYEGAGVHGIMILAGEPEVGTDVRALLDLSGAVIEFEVGANRPDCLSMIGIAREAAAAEGALFTLPKTEYQEGSVKTEEMVAVSVAAPDLCTRYVAAGVTDVAIGRSPAWMRTRLREAGIRPINNIVDITNFVMLETGQPMHAFDADKIRGRQIIVRRAGQKERMQTLDGKQREFDGSMLLICDSEGPVGVAGVMGGLDSEITDQTKNVVFESAKFGYGNIRQTSRALGLATESSMRFSKGVDAATTLYAMKRALTLIDQLGAGKAARGMIDILNENLTPKIIKTTAARVNALLGTEISAREMQQLLNRVSIETGLIGDELICTVPTYRADIFGSADIAEEVARMYGYDRIPETGANVCMKRGKISDFEKKADLMKYYLADAGYLECNTYPFTGVQDYEKLGLPLPESVKILNPLGDDTAYLRTTLAAQMLGTVALNLNRKNMELKLFEVARTFLPQAGEILPQEIPVICMAETGTDKDFYSLKGTVENIVRLVCGREISCVRAQQPFLHPGVCAEVLVDGQPAGIMGEVSLQTGKAFGIDQKVYLAQLDLQRLYAYEKPQTKYTPLPKFPAAARDLAVVVKADVPVGAMLERIKKAGGKRVERAELMSVYDGEQVGEGKKSVAYALTLRSGEGTMTDAEVEKVMARILKMLQEEFAAQLR